MPVIARPHSFSAPTTVHVPPGSTLADIVGAVVGIGDAIVQLEGEFIPKERWRHIRPKDHANVVLTVPLHGGNNWINTLLSIVVVVTAGAIIGPWAANLWGAGSLKATLFTAFSAAAGVALVNALFPIRMPSLGDRSQDSPTYGIGGGRNDARPFQAVPVVLGEHKHVPPLGARSYTEILGGNEWLRMLVAWGYGPLQISDIRIGQNPIDSYGTSQSFGTVERQTRQGYPSDAPVTLFPNIVLQEQIGVALRSPEGFVTGWVERTTEPDADEFSFDIVWPSGLISYDSKGNRQDVTVGIEYSWRRAGTFTWTERTLSVTRRTTSAVREGVRVAVARGQYEVRVRRVSPANDLDRQVDDTIWANLRTFRNASPLSFRKPLAVTAIRVMASDQLSGIIDNLSATVRSIVPIWNGSNWNTTAASSNPAALFRHVLTGPGNARPRTAAQLDDAALAAWYTFCAQQGYR
jgi:sulfur carrier protein ThiS